MVFLFPLSIRITNLFLKEKLVSNNQNIILHTINKKENMAKFMVRSSIMKILSIMITNVHINFFYQN